MEVEKKHTRNYKPISITIEPEVWVMLEQDRQEIGIPISRNLTNGYIENKKLKAELEERTKIINTNMLLLEKAELINKTQFQEIEKYKKINRERYGIRLIKAIFNIRD